MLVELEVNSASASWKPSTKVRQYYIYCRKECSANFSDKDKIKVDSYILVNDFEIYKFKV